MIPELIAAIPDRISPQFGDAAPGHKFLFYFASMRQYLPVALTSK